MKEILNKIIEYEYGIILLVSFVICVLKIFIDYCNKKNEQKIHHLKTILKGVIAGKRGWDEHEWSEHKKSITILLRVLETFDVLIDTEDWVRIKSILCDTILLPWARTHQASLFWTSRNKAVRIFLLYPKASDVPTIQSFLNDPSFFIRMGAVAALAKISSPEIVPVLLSHMAAESPAARFPYRHALLSMPLELLIFLTELYQESDDETIRAMCLDIMSHRIISNPIKMIKKDYQSQNPFIRYLIVKILGNVASEEAADDLVLFLKDPDPKIRAEAVASLGKLVFEKSFENVALMLHDDVYEVRLQAAIALSKYGKKGIHTLETQDWDIDPKAYQIARYVLTLP